jgi:hypothetical protein
MKKESLETTPLRITFGLLTLLIVAALTFTLSAYGLRLFFPYFIIVMGVTACLTAFVALPILLALIKLRRASLPVTVAVMAFVTFIVFLTWNYFALAGATTIYIGGKLLVENNHVTTAGLLAIFRESLITAVISAFSGACFWLVAFSRRSPAG